MFGRLFTEISEKIDCFVMAATNLHIYEYYLALIALEMSEMYVMTFKKVLWTLRLSFLLVWLQRNHII